MMNPDHRVCSGAVFLSFHVSKKKENRQTVGRFYKHSVILNVNLLLVKHFMKRICTFFSALITDNKLLSD